MFAMTRYLSLMAVANIRFWLADKLRDAIRWLEGKQF